MVDLTKILLSSDINYMKRSTANTGSTSLTLPAHGSTVSTTVTHNLGYIPYFDVFADLDGDGIIWAGEKVDQYTDSSNTGVEVASPVINSWTTTSTLTVGLDNTTTPTATGSRTVYWVVYLDYGNV